ncbi:methionine ABC transporter ATP-binding protein [uncultured Finegoldia sp.]|uniref:methionine ABC transporter ATP-binding protein n=1 Tax=uncultured Finegoldia sp. TaxID=328009 RepID=UPI00260C5EC5|nr:ATP-binding cassette domain-containing protein [uncultured Finegoldia sp.]
MIKVSNLKKTFKTADREFNAVDDVSFQVDKGEIFGIIGLSGAGKSTLVRLLNRLEEPTSGKVEIDDVDITSLKERDLLQARKEISMIFQQFNLFNQKNVFDNIAYPLKLRGASKNEIETRVNELLEFIGLQDRKNSYPSQLSGGQKQRVAIARALATNPKVILSDESTSALDPQNTQQVLEILKKSVEKYKTTIIMITHQMEVAKDICDRIAVMQDGKIIEENSVEELFKNPKTNVTRNFIRKIVEEDEEEIITDDFKGDVVRLIYSKASYNKPILSKASRQCDVDFNIISGNINKLQSTGVGYTVVELIGDSENIQKAKEIIAQNGIKVEEVK